MFAALRLRYDDAQIVELTSALAWENYRARFDHALGIEAEGYSEGGSVRCHSELRRRHDPSAVRAAFAEDRRGSGRAQGPLRQGRGPVAGGTDLLCNYKYELNAKPHLISLRDVDELQLFDSAHRRLPILDDVKDDAAFQRRAARDPRGILTISSHLLRQTGTVGGNLLADTRCFWFNQSRFWRESIGSCLKAEGDVCRVVWGAHECVAVYSGDLAPVLITLGCSVTVAGPKGRRIVPLDRFFQHDGITRHVLEPTEMLVDVRIPDRRRRVDGRLRKLRTRESFDFPVLGVVVALKWTPAGFPTRGCALEPSTRSRS